MGVLKADCSAAAAYVQITLSAPTHFFLEFDFFVPQATLDAIAGAGAPDYFTAEIGNFNDGLFGTSSDGVTWPYWTDLATGGTAGTFAVDAWKTARVEIERIGSNWHTIWTIDGVVTFTYDDGTSSSGIYASMPLRVGGYNANVVPGEIYYIDNVKLGTTAGGTDLFSEDFETDLSAWDSTPGSPTIVDSPLGGGGDTNTSGGVRVGIAFDDVTLEPTPTWTYLTDTANVAAGYDISRGGESEFEHTNPSSATVKLNDQDGLLDPTNSSGPYYGLIEPLLQIIIDLWNPVAEEWQTRFRGFIEDYDYTVEPFAHQNLLGDTVGVTRLSISCVDLEAILSAIEMQPGAFGDTPPPQSVDTVFFDNNRAGNGGPGDAGRIVQVLSNAGIPEEFYVVFSLNVNMQESVYSAGSNVMEVVQDAVDAEFPTVANRYIDRLGRMAIHGRLAKFDPDGTASDAGPDAWDFTRWKCGDGKAVAASPTDTAHIRTFAFNRGMSKVYNSALCTPNGIDLDPLATPLANQYTKDDPSIAQYGIRSWSAENLLIGAPTGNPLTAANAGILTGNNALDETKLVADFIVANYKTPRNRITDVTFRSMPPEQEGAGANWDLLCRIDISDVVEVTVDLPGGGGLSLEPFFVEGITESCEPLNGQYANVTLTPSLSPLAYFTDPSGLDGV